MNIDVGMTCVSPMNISLMEKSIVWTGLMRWIDRWVATVRESQRVCDMMNRFVCRLTFQADTYESACINRRDQSFMCETHNSTPMSTMPNGRCNGDDNDAADPLIYPTEEEKCGYLLKCTLSRSAEKNCPC